MFKANNKSIRTTSLTFWEQTERIKIVLSNISYQVVKVNNIICEHI